MEQKSKKILLVTPKSFYLFHHYLANEFEKKGYAVTIANDEYPESFIGKVFGKLGLGISRRITKQKIVNSYLKDTYYDLILIIKGRGLSIELIDEMKKVSGKVIGYTFDSIKYHKFPLFWWKSLDYFLTFDFRDSNVYGMRLLELFSSMPDFQDDGIKRDIELSVISRNHSDRLIYLEKTLKAIRFKTKFVYIYEKDIVTFLINFIRNPFLYIKYFKYIHFKPLDYSEFCSIMKRSQFTLDYAHPDQTGLTMRSFEAASAGTKLITNNSYIFSSPFYSENDAILFPLNGNESAFKESYNSLLDKPFIIRRRSIKNFIDDIISL